MKPPTQNPRAVIPDRAGHVAADKARPRTGGDFAEAKEPRTAARNAVPGHRTERAGSAQVGSALAIGFAPDRVELELVRAEERIGLC